MISRVCSKCNTLKQDIDFSRDRRRLNGFGYICKACFKVYSNTHYASNRESIALRRKQKRDQNRELWNSRNRNDYYRRKSYILAKMKKYHALPHIHLARNLRRRLHHVLKDKYKVGSAVRDLGCSTEFLQQYLEDRFQLGMSWDNYGMGPGKWNIDHIKPLCSFNLFNRDQFLQACNYTNLQPLWFEQNVSKGGKI